MARRDASTSRAVLTGLGLLSATRWAQYPSPSGIASILAAVVDVELAQSIYPCGPSLHAMSKREARTFAAAGVDVDAPRAKRRKEAPATPSTSPNDKKDPETLNTTVEAQQDDENTGNASEDKETVRERGLQLWQTLKDAVNKECVTSSLTIPD